MKAKEMKTPGWFRTKNEWCGSRPFFVKYLVEVEGRSAQWSLTRTTKAYGGGAVLKDGKLDVLYGEHVTLAKIDRPMTESEVIEFIESRRAYEVAKSELERAARDYIAAMSAALTEAGFQHNSGYDTITIDKRHIVLWATDNGREPGKDGGK